MLTLTFYSTPSHIAQHLRMERVMDPSGGSDNNPLNHNRSVRVCFVSHRACCERQKDALGSGTLHVLRKLTENLKTTGTHARPHMNTCQVSFNSRFIH